MPARALLLLLLLPGLAQAGRRPSDRERGEELYVRHCEACHGENGRGDGPATADLVVPVPSAHDVVTHDNVDDFVTVVLQGRGAMPAYAAVFDKYDARRVLRVMASRSARPQARVDDAPARVEPDADTDTDGPAAAPPGPDTDTDTDGTAP